MILKVNLWDKLVGILFWDENRNLASFEYESSFIQRNLDIAPFMMPPREGVIYDFPALNYSTFLGLPPMIADSLPDDFGNFLMNAWLSEQGKRVDQLLPTERLGYIGVRGMGALEYEPQLNKSLEISSNIDIADLIKVANEVYAYKGDLQFKKVNNESLSKLIRIGTSAGGARAKALLAKDERSGAFRAGDTLHGKGYSYWIIKLDGVSNKALGDPEGYGKIEYAYHLMAKDCGIEMSPSFLLPENDRIHFLTRRFDRNEAGEKIHMQTLSGLTGMDYRQPNLYSYEQVFTVLRQMKLPQKMIEQQYRRMVLNVIARNQDDHVKNISFLMDKSGKWVLSPAYDISYSHNPGGVWTNKHQLSINGKREEFEKSDIIKVGKENNIPSRTSIVSEIIEVVGNWRKYAKEVDIDKEIAKQIGKAHRLYL